MRKMHIGKQVGLTLVIALLGAGFCLQTSFAQSANDQKPVKMKNATGQSAADAALVARFRRLEKAWTDAQIAHDLGKLKEILAPDYRLTIAVSGRPLVQVDRSRWLANNATYNIHSYDFRDLSVRRVRDAVIVAAYYTQEATVGSSQQPRGGDFLITDVWIKQDGRWRVAWRLSSQPEIPGSRS